MPGTAFAGEPAAPLLELMLQDMREAPAAFRPTNFWDSALDRLTGEIRRKGLSSFRRQRGALSFYVPAYALYTPARKLAARLIARLPKGGALNDRLLLNRHVALCDYRIFRAADRDGPPTLRDVSESTLGEPLEQLDIDGRLYSRSLLNYLRALVFLKRNVDCSGLRSVLEIGGGFGSLGEILLKCPEQGMFYMDVDIPPVAYVATRYLQELFGEASVASYDVTRDWETISLDALRRDFRAAVLCPWQLPRLRGSFDLFANFHSFQEMEPDIVRNYAGCVSPLVSRHLLLRNSGVGKRVASKPGEVGVFEPTLRADYLDAFPDFELVASDSVVYGHHDPRFDSEVMVLERRSPAD